MTHHTRPEIVTPRKACAVNPLKSSAPLGAALAYLGMDGCLPMFHGSQGCTAFGLVLLVRHFREAIPFQTTAMNEISTILGGLDNVEQACVNIAKRAKPKLIGICSTGLTETRGEDIGPDLPAIKARNPELAGTDLVFAATPDYVGAMEEGWGRAVGAMIDAFVPAGALPRTRGQVNILPGVHMTPGDVEALRDMVESFGLSPIILPDLSGSLDGHVPDAYVGTTYGGTRLEDVARMGASVGTLAFGTHMAKAAARLEARTGVPTTLVPVATGLEAVDRLMIVLSDLAGGAPVPRKLRRQRSQLVDAMLDAHFFFGGKTIAMAAEPDLLRALSALFASLGAEICTAVTSVASPALDDVPAARVIVGDLEDLEDGALAAQADLLVTHSHGRQASERTGIPLWRAGFPLFDRLGAAHRVSIGYRGTRDIIFSVGNLLLDHLHHHHEGEAGHDGAHAASC